MKDGNNVGDVGLALETWEDIIHDIEMCNLLILSEKKEDRYCKSKSLRIKTQVSSNQLHEYQITSFFTFWNFKFE